MFLGEIIKEYREKNKMSMEEFAASAELSKGYISMLEKNKHPNAKNPIAPSLATFNKVARAMKMDVDTLLKAVDANQKVTVSPIPQNQSSFHINESDYFAEIILGKSMEPRIYEGDIAIVHIQNDVDSGDIAVVKVKGERTTKKIVKQENGILLVGLNTAAFTPEFYSYDDIEILGKVVEVRGKMDGWNK